MGLAEALHRIALLNAESIPTAGSASKRAAAWPRRGPEFLPYLELIRREPLNRG